MILCFMFLFILGCNENIINNSLIPGIWSGRVKDNIVNYIDIDTDIYLYVDNINEHKINGYYFHVNGYMTIGNDPIDHCHKNIFYTNYNIANNKIVTDCLTESNKTCTNATLDENKAIIDIKALNIYSYEILLENYTFVTEDFSLDICQNYKDTDTVNF